jgi:hypothetical protein
MAMGARQKFHISAYLGWDTLVCCHYLSSESKTRRQTTAPRLHLQARAANQGALPFRKTDTNELMLLTHVHRISTTRLINSPKKQATRLYIHTTPCIVATSPAAHVSFNYNQAGTIAQSVYPTRSRFATQLVPYTWLQSRFLRRGAWTCCLPSNKHAPWITVAASTEIGCVV